MKKFLFVLAIGAFVACGEGTEGEAPAADSAATTVDTATTLAPVDTTTAAPVDSASVDSAK